MADISVDVTKLRSDKGVIHACLTSDKKGFPDCDSQPAAHKATIPADGKRQIKFSNIKPGRYAIAILHDENNNGKVDKALMIPKEGFGFSRDAKVRMGPPKFDAAAIDVKAGSNSHSIRMRYIF